MNIVRSTDVNHVGKPEGTSVWYYLFNDYEVHYNDQAPNTTQTWHHHERISETLYIIEGQLTAKWREGDNEKSTVVRAGDLIETEKSPHTFCNDTDQIVRFLVIKRVSDEMDYRGVFKTDKVVDE